MNVNTLKASNYQADRSNKDIGNNGIGFLLLLFLIFIPFLELRGQKALKKKTCIDQWFEYRVCVCACMHTLVYEQVQRILEKKSSSNTDKMHISRTTFIAYNVILNTPIKEPELNENIKVYGKQGVECSSRKSF